MNKNKALFYPDSRNIGGIIKYKLKFFIIKNYLLIGKSEILDHMLNHLKALENIKPSKKFI
jgi:hypothetical protein